MGIALHVPIFQIQTIRLHSFLLVFSFFVWSVDLQFGIVFCNLKNVVTAMAKGGKRKKIIVHIEKCKGSFRWFERKYFVFVLGQFKTFCL